MASKGGKTTKKMNGKKQSKKQREEESRLFQEMKSKLTRPSAREMERIGPMIIEETSERYDNVTDRNLCNLQGGVHPSRVPFLEKVNVLKFSDSGAYLVKDLHRFPHYQVETARLEEFMADEAFARPKLIPGSQKTMSKRRAAVPLRVYEPGDGWVSNETICVVNTRVPHAIDTDSHRGEIDRLIDELDLDDLLVECIMREQKGNAINPLRNAVQIHCGFTGNHSLSRKNSANLPRPQLIRGGVTEKDKKRWLHSPESAG